MKYLFFATILAVLLSLNSFAQLSGTYTVGGSSPNFPSIDSAVSAMERVGVSGPVTIYIRSGNYNESVTVDKIAGVSTTNTVTLLGDTVGFRPKLSSSLIPLTFDNVAHIKVRNLEISGSYLSTILFTGSNSNIWLDSNIIIGKTAVSLKYDEAVIYRPTNSTSLSKNIWITNNEIIQGSVGICWLNSIKRGSGHRFENNYIHAYYGIGMLVGNQDSLSVRGNNIITKNPQAGSSGIGLTGMIKGVIEQNRIHIVNGGAGIVIQQAISSGVQKAAIRNNFISLGNGFNSYGIYVIRSSNFDIVHNTINSYGTSNSSFCYRQFQGKNILFRNNIVANNGIGMAIVVDNVLDYNGDYNNLYVSTSGQFGIIGSMPINSFTAWKTNTSQENNSISVKPFFVDSVNLHVSAKSLKGKGTPLGLAYDIDNEQRNIGNPDIGADEFIGFHVDGGLRNDDANVCLGKSPIYVTLVNYGKADITNVDLYWELSTNGGAFVAQSPVNWSGTLTSSADTLILLDSIGISKQRNYKFRAYLTKVNGKLDSNNTNDTANVTVLPNLILGLSFTSVKDFCVNDSLYTFVQGKPLGGKYSGKGVLADSIFKPNVAGAGTHKITYTFVDTNECSDTVSTLVVVNEKPNNKLGVDTALCPKQTLTLSATSTGYYLWSSGDTTKQLTVTSKGEYWLLITNKFGCAQSDTINVSFNEVCTGIDRELMASSTISYFPNPSYGRFKLKLNAKFEGELELTIQNMQGQILFIQSWKKVGDSLVQEIDLSEQPSGVYFLNLKTPLGRAQHKITLRR